MIHPVENPLTFADGTTIGQWVREERKRRKLQQEDLSCLSGGVMHISHIEGERTHTSLSTVMRLCAALEISLEDFVERVYRGAEDKAEDEPVETIPGTLTEDEVMAFARLSLQEDSTVANRRWLPDLQADERYPPLDAEDIARLCGVVTFEDIQAMAVWWYRNTDRSQKATLQHLKRLCKWTPGSRKKLVEIVDLDRERGQRGRVIALFWRASVFASRLDELLRPVVDTAGRERVNQLVLDRVIAARWDTYDQVYLAVPPRS